MAVSVILALAVMWDGVLGPFLYILMHFYLGPTPSVPGFIQLVLSAQGSLPALSSRAHAGGWNSGQRVFLLSGNSPPGSLLMAVLSPELCTADTQGLIQAHSRALPPCLLLCSLPLEPQQCWAASYRSWVLTPGHISPNT